MHNNLVLVQISGSPAAAMHTAEALLESDQVDYATMGTASYQDEEGQETLTISIFAKAPAT